MESQGRSGLGVTKYMGVEASTPPQYIIEERDPTMNDYRGYAMGTLWHNYPYTKLWMLVDQRPAEPNKWILLYPATTAGASVYNCDIDSAVAVNGVLNVIGAANITTSGDLSNNLRIDLSDDVVINTTLSVTPITNSTVVTDAFGTLGGVTGTDLQFMMSKTGPVYEYVKPVSDDGTVTIAWSSVTPGAVSFTAAGGGGGGFDGLIADDANTATPTSNKVQVYGDGTNIMTTAAGHTLTISMDNGNDGECLIGGGTNPTWAQFTSSDNSIIFTRGANQLDMVAVGGGGSSGVIKLGADVGTPALPLLGEIDIVGGTNINTITAPNAVVVNLDDWISLPSTNSLGTTGGMSLNSIRFLHGYGPSGASVFLGFNAGNLAADATKSTKNVGIGTEALNAIDQATDNVAIGYRAMYTYPGTTRSTSAAAGRNVAIGSLALQNATVSALGTDAATSNVAIGYAALSGITTGDSNIAINGGGSYSGVESSNICIGATGTTGESLVTRLGTSQTKCYIAGVYGAGTDAPGAQQYFAITDSTKKLYSGLAAFGAKDGSILSTYTDVYGVKQARWGTITSPLLSIKVNVTSAGNIELETNGTKCAFHAIQNSTAPNVTGDGTLYNLGTNAALTEIYDYTGSFYGGSGAGAKALFTAPKTGLYQFIVTVLATNLTPPTPPPTPTRTRRDPINIVTTNRTYSLINPVMSYTNDDGLQTVTFTTIADMTLGHTAYFQFGLQTSVGTKTIGIGATYTTVSGFFIA